MTCTFHKRKNAHDNVSRNHQRWHISYIIYRYLHADNISVEKLT